MSFAGQSAVVTGAGQGIGRALARALAQSGAQVVVSDRDPARAQAVAVETGGLAVACDVTQPDQIAALAEAARHANGAIDIWISNAGFAAGEPSGAASAPDAQWQASWEVHVMAHLRAARLVLPEMTARGSGRLVNIASAAGLLCQVGDAAYSATKHAAVSLAQSLAIDHGDAGVQVSVVCPLFVATPLLGYADDAPQDRPHDRVLLPEDVARATLDGMREGRFLILPHPEAAEYLRRRAADTDRWIEGMRRMRRGMGDVLQSGDFAAIHRHI
ncbi:MAG: SDR family oxidoreductase [Roseivivax sp.]|nr:SDR family oxidoreductase [Roseivivax sp.]